MIDYTRAAFDKTVSDLKRFGYVFNVTTELLSIAYLVYAIVVRAGFIYANIALCALSFAYLVFYVVTAKDKHKKAARDTTKQIYKYSKIAIRAVTLGITVYGIYIATEHVTFISVVMAAATTISWTLNLLVTLFVGYISAKARFIVAAIEADIETVKRPFEKVNNIVKKIKGEEITPEEPPSKTRVLLESAVFNFREKKKREKAEMKEIKRQKKEGREESERVPIKK